MQETFNFCREIQQTRWGCGNFAFVDLKCNHKNIKLDTVLITKLFLSRKNTITSYTVKVYELTYAHFSLFTKPVASVFSAQWRRMSV